MRIFIGLLAIFCSGCVTASLATMGTVIGAVGAAASTGADVYHLGKLEAALQCSGEQCHHAVVQAEVDLGLHYKIDQRNDHPTQVWEITVVDDLKSPLGVRITSVSKRLSLCRVDVGIFGSEAIARLFVERIRVHLIENGVTPPPPTPMATTTPATKPA